MNYIYENILKPLLKILERFFIPKNSKEFVIIINFIDVIYDRGSNLLNNFFFIFLFPILYFPIINIIFFIIGGSIITILDIVFAVTGAIKKRSAHNASST